MGSQQGQAHFFSGAAAGGSETAASGVACSTVMRLRTAPRQQAFRKLLVLGKSIPVAGSCKGKCLWLPRKDEPSFLSILLSQQAHKCNKGTSICWCLHPSLMLTGRKTTLEHGSSLLFLRPFFFVNIEPEITFPN